MFFHIFPCNNLFINKRESSAKLKCIWLSSLVFIHRAKGGDIEIEWETFFKFACTIFSFLLVCITFRIKIVKENDEKILGDEKSSKSLCFFFIFNIGVVPKYSCSAVFTLGV